MAARTGKGREEFEAAFQALRRILARYEGRMDVLQDAPDAYVLNTRKVDPRNKKPVFFGGVAIKSYVAFHLMPVYVFPDLLKGISPELRKRMQGKSCFNFKAVDKSLFKELEALTKAGFERFRQGGLA
jgi:hypothetical protein